MLLGFGMVMVDSGCFDQLHRVRAGSTVALKQIAFDLKTRNIVL